MVFSDVVYLLVSDDQHYPCCSLWDPSVDPDVIGDPVDIDLYYNPSENILQLDCVYYLHAVEEIDGWGGETENGTYAEVDCAVVGAAVNVEVDCAVMDAAMDREVDCEVDHDHEIDCAAMDREVDCEVDCEVDHDHEIDCAVMDAVMNAVMDAVMNAVMNAVMDTVMDGNGWVVDQ